MIFSHSNFNSATGIREDFFAITPRPGIDFAAEVSTLLAEYEQRLPEFGCSLASEMFLRFHLSDVTTQSPVLQKLLANRQAFVSIVGQQPTETGSRVALEAWHWSNAAKSGTSSQLQISLQNYQPLWFNLPQCSSQGSFDQTAEEFACLKDFLAQHNANIKDHTVRTWLYCRDVDNNYAGLVDARNKFFARNGLTADTHFIASTGIEGQSSDVHRLVQMDSLSYPDLQAGQMFYLTAPEMLSPTTIYGVSFERGTRLIFGDRSHYFISGTASIDKAGMVVHVGDVRKQTMRMLDNIEALLQSGDAQISDIVCGTLYLRDPADSAQVLNIVRQRLGRTLPLVTVKAPVCRPAWLVELECIAINNKGNANYADLK